MGAIAIRAQELAAVHIRWTIRRDLAQVAAIGARAGGGWTRDDFLAALGRRDSVGMLAERGPMVVGHMVYALRRGSVDLVQFRAADPAAAVALLEKLVYKTGSHRRGVLAVPFRLVRAFAGVTLCCEDDPGLSCLVLTGLPDVPPSTNARLVMAGRGDPAIVADALEDDGCGDAELLAALRAGGSLAALIVRQWVWAM